MDVYLPFMNTVYVDAYSCTALILYTHIISCIYIYTHIYDRRCIFHTVISPTVYVCIYVTRMCARDVAISSMLRWHASGSLLMLSYIKGTSK